MQVLVLGSAAGGGFPQWNCHCPQCSACRQGSSRAQPRTQSSIAVSDNGEDWVLINASPDIRQQINANSQIASADGARGSGIRAVVVTDSQIDHTTGLLILREGLPLDLYCTEMVRADLSESFPLLKMMTHWHGGYRQQPISVAPDAEFTIPQVPGLRFEPVPLKSNAPPYSPHRNDYHVGDSIGLKITDKTSGKVLFYAPGLGELSGDVLAALAQADCAMVDGTLWQDDEMLRLGLGSSLGSQMGHLSVSGEQGMLALLSPFQRLRKILIHINNTNPILDPDSPEYAQVCAAGVEVAFDGMLIQL
ncbi:pyrroloquinoline quinone biosynthesis protein PqqB [Shewanella sp. GXUN23E]|uniref:pyrroloquinoline quinone biosynthesis protein PqqB n=1 Tax=Shewanella sp. GXUN23E TaxID=3422498 RepID=UPI003D7D7826